MHCTHASSAKEQAIGDMCHAGLLEKVVLTELEGQAQPRSDERLRALAVLQQLLAAFSATLTIGFAQDTAKFFCDLLPTLTELRYGIH